MNMNLQKSILRSILVNKKVGTNITSKKFEKLKVWKNELKPYLEKLQKMGYINGSFKSKDINFKIIKPISLTTLNQL